MHTLQWEYDYNIMQLTVAVQICMVSYNHLIAMQLCVFGGSRLNNVFNYIVEVSIAVNSIAISQLFLSLALMQLAFVLKVYMIKVHFCSDDFNYWGEPEQAPHWSVVNTSVACTKIYITNTESPTLGSHFTSIVRASRARLQKRKAPHLNTWCNISLGHFYTGRLNV